MSGPRWQNQYQRIADVLQQRAEQLRPPPPTAQELRIAEYVRQVTRKPPSLSAEDIQWLRDLVPPAPADAAINDPVKLARAAKIFRLAQARRAAAKP